MRTVDKLPRGYAYVNDIQLSEWENDNTIHGASSIVFAEDGLAVRLRRPSDWFEIVSFLPREEALRLDLGASEALAWYVREYENGWKSAGRGGSFGALGNPNTAWEDGYLDRKFERPKWHLTYCTDHDNCGE